MGPTLFDRIDKGEIHEFNLETIESFLSSYPKDKEI